LPNDHKHQKKPAKVTTTIPCITPLLKNGSFHVGIDTFLHTTHIQGYNSHFVCARVVTVFSGACQQNFAGAGHTGANFDLKNVPAKFMMQSCAFFPPPMAAATAADAATITARLLL
jgi:hypothetical protein